MISRVLSLKWKMLLPLNLREMVTVENYHEPTAINYLQTCRFTKQIVYLQSKIRDRRAQTIRFALEILVTVDFLVSLPKSN